MSGVTRKHVDVDDSGCEGAGICLAQVNVAVITSWVCQDRDEEEVRMNNMTMMSIKISVNSYDLGLGQRQNITNATLCSPYTEIYVNPIRIHHHRIASRP